jgi:hypothetical protein
MLSGFTATMVAAAKNICSITDSELRGEAQGQPGAWKNGD